MSLINQPAQAAPATSKPAEAKKEGGEKSFKERKLEALKRFKEKRAKESEEAKKAAIALHAELTKSGLIKQLSAESQAFVAKLIAPPATRAAGQPATASIFTLLFGTEPKVGTSVTLEEAFKKTFKGKSTLDVWVKRWAEKGTVVEIINDATNPLATKYVLKALPAAAV
jgi:hypothetical protein